MNEDVLIAVVGAGLIGRSHVRSITAVSGVRLGCIVDPSDGARDFAGQIGVDWFPSLDDMFSKTSVDGVILATPNQVHLDGALMCIANRCPVLVEKPLATSASEAKEIVRAAKTAGVAVLTGHHRRHSATVKKAKAVIDSGALGRVIAVQGTCWFHKPDEYFDVAWRSQPGGGPIFINLIHDVNTFLHLFGDVASVQAMASNTARNGAVEDSAAIILRFQTGVLGTISVCDAAAAPWSWELTAAENPAYPATGQASYQIGGTKASLSMPNLTLWQHEGRPDWMTPIEAGKIQVTDNDPLIEQIRQFAAVIRGQETALVSGAEGLKTLQVIEAIKASITAGKTITLSANAP